MTGAGCEREHLAVGLCIVFDGERKSLDNSVKVLLRPWLHLVSLLMVHLIFPMARDLKEALDTAVTEGLVTSLMVQMLRVKL